MKLPDKLKTAAPLWISRDSFDGKLSDRCFVWYAKPRRVGTEWVASDMGAQATWAVGAYRVDDLRAWFGTAPDTYSELIKIGA